MKKIFLLLFVYSLSVTCFSDSSDYQTRGDLFNGEVRSIVDNPSGFMGLSKAKKISSNDHGSPLTFSIMVKTTDVKGAVKLWFRLDNKSGGQILLKHRKPIRGSNSWKRYSLTTPNLPYNTNLIAFGVFLQGAGKVEMQSPMLK